MTEPSNRNRSAILGIGGGLTLDAPGGVTVASIAHEIALPPWRADSAAGACASERRSRSRRKRDVDGLAWPRPSTVRVAGVAAALEPDLVPAGRDVERVEGRGADRLAVDVHERLRGLRADAQLGRQRLHHETQGQEGLAVRTSSVRPAGA